MREHRYTLLLGITLIMLGTILVDVVEAQVMQSSSYQVQSDSINVGGLYSSSSNYQLEDTAGEIATGESGSASFGIRAGYQQTTSVFLSLTGGSDITMSPTIAGVSGGTSNGSTTVTALTDNPAGYQLDIRASNDPAMQSAESDTIADYDSGNNDPDFAFVTAATSSQLGFSPEGSDIIDRFKDNGADCSAGSGDTTLACWDGLTTADQTIASGSSSNVPSGTETVINFRVGIGGTVNQAPGTYVATTTMTLIAL